MPFDEFSLYHLCFLPLKELLLWPLGYSERPDIHDGPTHFFVFGPLLGSYRLAESDQALLDDNVSINAT